MEKKEYMSPETTVVTLALQQLMAFSGGGEGESDPQVDPEEDDTEGGTNRSRRRTYNCWEDEELEEEFENEDF